MPGAMMRRHRLYSEKFAKMDGFTEESVESDSFDIAITKLSQLLGEDVAA